MEALAVGSAPPRPGLAAPTRYPHLRAPRTLVAARRPLAAAPMEAAGGGRSSPAPARCASAETVSSPCLQLSSSVRREFRPNREVVYLYCTRALVQESEVDEAATSSPAAEAEAAGATEQGGNGSPVADAAAAGASIEGVDGIRIRRRPVTGPAVHYVGPFQFRLENEGNTPRNILEKIVWDKDVEVSQARL